MARSKSEHVNLLKVAEQQFRFACTAHFALAAGTLCLDVPIEWTFGHHRTDYKEFGLRPDQAAYAASALECISTFAMASVIAEAFKDCVPNAPTHPETDVVSAFRIARLLRDAFAHGVLSPVWCVKPALRNKVLAITDVISIDTTDLDGKAFDWRHYGGHLAVWRFSQWVRFNVLGDSPLANRVEPARPKTEAYQQGRLIFRRADGATESKK
jgi:hypothetical protein